MDTRAKIVTPEEAASRYTEYALVLASFDVLTVRRIQDLRAMSTPARPLIALIGDVPGSLLSLQARAELAASLAIIDCVIVAGDTAGLLANAAAIFDERAADTRRTSELIEHVQQRTRG